MMEQYDPDTPPNADEWLSLSEDERIRLIERYYEREGGYGGSLEVHAKVHATIETQLARDIVPVKAAFVRLRDNGLGRREAIRAIGSVLGKRIRKINDPEDLTAQSNREYFSALESLIADTSYAGRDRERGLQSGGADRPPGS